MPKIDVDTLPEVVGTPYPAALDGRSNGRRLKRLGDAGGLTQLGVHRVTVPAGGWSSHRHWHSAEDELVYVLSGEGQLIDDHGPTPLRAGDVCAHPAGDGNAHHVVNGSDADLVLLVVGARRPEVDHCRYPDVDLDVPATGAPARVFRRKDGTPYP